MTTKPEPVSVPDEINAMRIDYDLTRVMVPADQPGPPATWPVGDLVAIDGGISYVVEHKDGAQLPVEACAHIDPEVTR